jgi:hypothetical protein
MNNQCTNLLPNLEVGSVKAALSRPAWLSRTQAVGWLLIFEVWASILFAAHIDIKVVKRKRSVSPAQVSDRNEIPPGKSGY